LGTPLLNWNSIAWMLLWLLPAADAHVSLTPALSAWLPVTYETDA
jgi:hypothetical protein